MKTKNLLTALFIFLSNAVYAQSFYEMVFHFGGTKPSEISYIKAFYLLNDDGTGDMRISYTGATPGESFIIECGLKQGFGLDKEKNYDYSKMYYTGKDFIYVDRENKPAEFPPITFWFKYNEEYDQYDPWAVMSKDLKGNTLQGLIDELKLLEDKDFTKEFVLTYFTKDDEIYKNLFATNIRALTPEEKKSKMYFLVVADTDDEQIGPDCLKDKEKQLAYFKKIADKLEIGFIPSELSGKELNRNNLLQRIDAITPTKNDIVIFHYSGHGYSKNDNRQFPYLDLRYDKDIPVREGDEINMEDVYELIKNKPGRLNLVISDCCNWHLSMSNMQSANIANPRPSPVGLSLENMKALFMDPNRTSLLITAAQKGEVSAGNAVSGGIFSGQFRDALQKYMGINYQNITWEQITQNVRTQTVTVAGYSNCPRPENPQVIGACKQTPVYKLN
ncbi:MAG: caspase family protein [Chitinophagaceae bacterium]|nr:caspase family protein [Chitinophagaceae bacterium]